MERAEAAALLALLFAGARWALIRAGALRRGGAAHEALLLVFDVYIAAVLSLTFIPFRFTFPPVRFQFQSMLLMLIRGQFVIGSWWRSMIVLNVCMFLPMGALMPVLWRQKWWQTLGLSLGAILCVELLQPFADRSFDVDDIVLNLTGAILGVLLAAVLKKLFPEKMQRAWSRRS